MMAYPLPNLYDPQMHFPVEDVVKNVRHFMASVKRVTGNTKDAEDSRRLKNSGAKPG